MRLKLTLAALVLLTVLAKAGSMSLKSSLPDEQLTVAREYTYVHEPVVERRCGACHIESAAADSQGVSQQCRNCHSERYPFGSLTAAGDGHGNLECTSCHNPHVSDLPFLLAAPLGELCAGCHEVKPASPSKFSHFSDNCDRCHDPHRITTKYYLKSDVISLCQDNCHTSAKLGRSHPMGPGVYDKYAKSDLTCTSSCHRVHNSNYPTFLAAHPDKICYRCHAEIFVGKSGVFAQESP